MKYRHMKPVVIGPERKFSWATAFWQASAVCWLAYMAVVFIGLRGDRDEWRSMAETLMAEKATSFCPAPADICPQWWFGSKDLAATRKRICK